MNLNNNNNNKVGGGGGRGGGGNDDDNGEVDRISDLPQGILHHILSFLDIQPAIQTCILSSKWRYVWRSLPFLNFDQKVFFDKNLEGKVGRIYECFEDFISNVVQHRDPSSRIRKFHLHYPSAFLAIDNDCFQKWTTLTSSSSTSIYNSGLEDLYLSMCVTDDFKLPEYVFVTCKSLKKLELAFSYMHRLTLPNSMSLPCLKTLVLSKVVFAKKEDNDNDNDIVKKIIDSCPSLESLNFTGCVIFQSRLEICSSKLKQLVMKNSEFYTDYGKNITINVYAPNLVTLSCWDDMSYSIEYVSYNSCLVMAGICLSCDIAGGEPKQWSTQWVMELLKALENVKTLELSTSFFEVIAGAPATLMECSTPPIMFCNVKHLKLGTCLSKDHIIAIMPLLNIAPIESIVITIQETFEAASYPFLDEVINLDSAVGDWESSVLSQSMSYQYLKFVKIEGVCRRLNELMFLKSLLKNSVVLEKMLIHTPKEYEPSPDTETRHANFRNHVLALPRASACIDIVLC